GAPGLVVRLNPRHAAGRRASPFPHRHPRRVRIHKASTHRPTRPTGSLQAPRPKPTPPMSHPTVTRAATYAAALAAIALAPFTAQAQSSPASELETLREQIRLLDQKLKVLERNLELRDETAAAEAKKLPK